MLGRTTRRLTAATAASVASIALVAGPAGAAANEGPDAFDSVAKGAGLHIVVGLPDGLAEALASVPGLDQLPGITLVGADLDISIADAIAELELPLVDGVPTDVIAAADATSIGGSLAGLVSEVTGVDNVRCLNSPVNVSIPENSATPLVHFELLSAECTKDATGRLAIAASRVGNLEVNLAGAFDILGILDTIESITGVAIPVPPQLEETVATVEAGVRDGYDALATLAEDTVLGDVRDTLTTVEGVIQDTTGLDIPLHNAVRLPALLDVPLVRIDLIDTVTQTKTEGDMIRSVASTTLASASLAGTVCLNDTTYTAEAFATGEPGGNDYAVTIPTISLGICDADGLVRLLELIETDGVLSDVHFNFGDNDTIGLDDLLNQITETADAGVADIVNEIVPQLENLLATAGVTAIVQGRIADEVRTADGREAGVTVEPFRVGVQPFGALADAAPQAAALRNVRVELTGLGNSVYVQAANVDQVVPAAPGAPGAPPVKLPKTGGGAAAAILGLLGTGGALALRKR